MPEITSENPKNKGGRPKKLNGDGKTHIVSIRLNDKDFNNLKRIADNFSKSSYNVSLYVHSKLFDNCFQQLSGEQLLATIKSIVDAIESNNSILSHYANQIEVGVKNQSVSPLELDELKKHLAKHSLQVQKLQKCLSKALRAATTPKFDK